MGVLDWTRILIISFSGIAISPCWNHILCDWSRAAGSRGSFPSAQCILCLVLCHAGLWLIHLLTERLVGWLVDLPGSCSKFMKLGIFQSMVCVYALQDYWMVDYVWWALHVRKIMHRNTFQGYSWSLHLSDPDTDEGNDIKKEDRQTFWYSWQVQI